MKLIFLDIDGVLNSAYGEGPYESEMETDKLILLRKMINDSSSDGVVIISDRRSSQIDMSHKEEVFDKYEIKIIGTTRNPNHKDFDDNRGKQIMDYLISSKDEITKMVILDDMDDGISDLFFENYIHINRLYGLNEEIYTKALSILS